MTPAEKQAALEILAHFPGDEVMRAGICLEVARHTWPIGIKRADFFREHDSKGKPTIWALRATTRAGSALLECYEGIDLGLTAGEALAVVVEGM